MRIGPLHEWLSEVRTRVAGAAPDLLGYFEICAGEAVFGRQYIDDDLRTLQRDASVLEIGAGAMLLSCQLVREGYAVTALEPGGSGFSHLARLRAVVLSVATEAGCVPRVIDRAAESYIEPRTFDYAFSVNVMEHVSDPARVISTVADSLKAHGAYRFTCPNYRFPYEPHFNMPTFFSKSLTEKLLWKRIANAALPDALGTWRSLNWIDVGGIARHVRSEGQLSVTFNRHLVTRMFERMACDEAFAARRGKRLRSLLLIAVKLRLHRVVAWLPPALQPVIDCRITRRGMGAEYAPPSTAGRVVSE